MFPVYYIFNFLMTTLLILHVIWFTFLVKIAIQVSLVPRYLADFWPCRWLVPTMRGLRTRGAPRTPRERRTLTVKSRRKIKKKRELNQIYSIHLTSIP